MYAGKAAEGRPKNCSFFVGIMRRLNFIFVVALVTCITALVFSIGVMGNQRRLLAQNEFTKVELRSNNSAGVELASELRLLWSGKRLNDITATRIVESAVGPISDDFRIILIIRADDSEFEVYCRGGRCTVDR